MATQQEVIKKFMKYLDTTSKKGEAALNAAIKFASNSAFKNFATLKKAMINDAKNSDFLKTYCGIDYSTEDNGAITGSDAGGSTSKTDASVIPESGSLKTYKKTSFTKKGLTVKLGDGKTYKKLTASEKFIWNGLYTWWVEGALNLIEESYGENFGYGKKSSATVKEISVTFNNEGTAATTYRTYYLATGKTATLNLNINMNHWNSLKNNLTKANTEFDRTIAHELTHAAMAANILCNPVYDSLPGFVREGLAELTIGIENSRKDLIQGLNASKFESGLDASNTGTNESFMYEGGFTFFRYLARQAGDLTINTGTSKTTVKTFYGSDTIESSGDKVTIDSGANDDSIRSWGNNVKIFSGSGNDNIINDNYYGKANKVTIDGGSGNDYIVSYGNNVSIAGGSGNDSIWSHGLKATLYGDSGADILVGGDATDKLYGGAGNDSIWGEGGNDVLYGDAGSDKLIGGEGNDKLYGGNGNDSLWGGKGNDTFIYTANEGTDTIFDYEKGDMLKILNTDGSQGKFKSSKYSGGDLTLTITGGGKVIFDDVSSSTQFNINGTTYNISGSKLKKQ